MILIHPTLDIPSQTLSITIPAYLSEPSSTHVIPISPPASSEYLTDLGIWGKSGFDGYSVGTPALLSALSHFMGREVLLVSKGAEKRESGEDGYIDQLKEEGVIDLEYVDGKQESSTIAWADQFPILVVNEASLAEIDERVRKDDRVDQKRWAVGEEALEMSRFRGNVVLTGAEAWTEDGWSGLMIGEKGSEEELYVAARCARCMVRLFPLLSRWTRLTKWTVAECGPRDGGARQGRPRHDPPSLSRRYLQHVPRKDLLRSTDPPPSISYVLSSPW